MKYLRIISLLILPLLTVQSCCDEEITYDLHLLNLSSLGPSYIENRQVLSKHQWPDVLYLAEESRVDLNLYHRGVSEVIGEIIVQDSSIVTTEQTSDFSFTLDALSMGETEITVTSENGKEISIPIYVNKIKKVFIELALDGYFLGDIQRYEYSPQVFMTPSSKYHFRVDLRDDDNNHLAGYSEQWRFQSTSTSSYIVNKIEGRQGTIVAGLLQENFIITNDKMNPIEVEVVDPSEVASIELINRDEYTTRYQNGDTVMLKQDVYDLYLSVIGKSMNGDDIKIDKDVQLEIETQSGNCREESFTVPEVCRVDYDCLIHSEGGYPSYPLRCYRDTNAEIKLKWNDLDTHLFIVKE